MQIEYDFAQKYSNNQIIKGVLLQRSIMIGGAEPSVAVNEVHSNNLLSFWESEQYFKKRKSEKKSEIMLPYEELCYKLYLCGIRSTSVSK